MCCAQIVEVIREHRFYEKTFVVETRPAGERELIDRQRVCFAHPINLNGVGVMLSESSLAFHPCTTSDLYDFCDHPPSLLPRES